MSPLSKYETHRDSSRAFIICHYTGSKPCLTVYVFLCIVLLAVRMVADVTEIRNVIPSLDFKTWTKKS